MPPTIAKVSTNQKNDGESALCSHKVSDNKEKNARANIVAPNTNKTCHKGAGLSCPIGYEPCEIFGVIKIRVFALASQRLYICFLFLQLSDMRPSEHES